MKIIVRVFVVVLALTGAVATTQTSAASARTIASSPFQTSTGAIPTCPPDGTTDCGLAANNPKGK